MNNMFSIKRFGLLLKKDFIENWKRYALYFLGIVGIMTLFQIFSTNAAYDSFKYQHSYGYLNVNLLTRASFFFVASGIFFAALTMEPMKEKTRRISYLYLPASSLEKYFSRWLIITVGYIVVFFIAVWVAEWLRVTICSLRYPDIEVESLNLKYLAPFSEREPGHYLVNDVKEFILVLGVYFLFQSLFVLGSTFWEKHSFLKTFAAIAGIITVFVLVCRWLIVGLYGSFGQFDRSVDTYFQISDKMTENQMFTVIIIVSSVFTLANWVIAYFRFRESEIIKRW